MVALSRTYFTYLTLPYLRYYTLLSGTLLYPQMGSEMMVKAKVKDKR